MFRPEEHLLIPAIVVLIPYGWRQLRTRTVNRRIKCRLMVLPCRLGSILTAVVKPVSSFSLSWVASEAISAHIVTKIIQCFPGGSGWEEALGSAFHGGFCWHSKARTFVKCMSLGLLSLLCFWCFWFFMAVVLMKFILGPQFPILICLWIVHAGPYILRESISLEILAFHSVRTSCRRRLWRVLTRMSSSIDTGMNCQVLEVALAGRFPFSTHPELSFLFELL